MADACSASGKVTNTGIGILQGLAGMIGLGSLTSPLTSKGSSDLNSAKQKIQTINQQMELAFGNQLNKEMSDLLSDLKASQQELQAHIDWSNEILQEDLTEQKLVIGGIAAVVIMLVVFLSMKF